MMKDHKHHSHGQKHEPGAEPGAPQQAVPQPAQPSSQAAPVPEKSELDVVKAQKDDLLARLQRVSADFMNYQKRVGREVNEAREFAIGDLLKSLLVVLDDMDRAVEVGRSTHPAEDPLLKGLELVRDKAMETLGRAGLEQIKATGQPFDPTFHSALMQQPSDKVPPHTVLQELRPGYQLKGRILRPAGVVVSAEPEKGDEQAGQEQ